MASIRKRNGRYQAQVRIGSVSKSASFSSKAEARAWAAGEEAATLFLSLEAPVRYTAMDMANAVIERRIVELVIAARTLMCRFCVFLLIFLIKIISYFLMRMFFRKSIRISKPC